MEVKIDFRHSKGSDSLKETIKDELDKLNKFYHNITSAHVVLDEESGKKTVEVIVHVHDHTFTATAKTDNTGKSLDEAIEKVERQLKKLNEKMKDHKHPKVEVKEPAKDDGDEEIE